MYRKKIVWRFDNTYSSLPKSMFAKINPTPVKTPKLVLFNHDLSKEIDLDFSDTNNKELALIFSGNKMPDGSESIAQAYAGHQFGHFNPVLGDGRALLLGETVNTKGELKDIQLKGSGPTPFSRRGDGKSAL